MDLTDSPKGQELNELSEKLLAISKRSFTIPQADKDAVGSRRLASLFGYKGTGSLNAGDELKRKDQSEFWTVSKGTSLASSKPNQQKTNKTHHQDDVMAEKSTIPYPQVIQEQFPSVFRPFCKDAHGVCQEILKILAQKLAIDEADLLGRHRFEPQGNDMVRLTYGPADKEMAPVPLTEEQTRITTYAHKDYGSVTLLWNWLGGLQIENRSTGEWEWVRPLKGHCICNLGHTMVQYAGGKVQAGYHRVVGAPGAQALHDRYSVVYFSRPEDAAYLENLTVPEADRYKNGEEKITANDWITDQMMAVSGLKRGTVHPQT